MKSLSQKNIRNKLNEGRIIDISSQTFFNIKKPIPILSRYKIKGINDKVILPKIKIIPKKSNNFLSIKNHFLKNKVRFIPEINLDCLFKDNNNHKTKLKKNLSDFTSSISTLSTLPLSSRPFYFKKNLSNINITNNNIIEKKKIVFNKKNFDNKYQLQKYFLEKRLEKENKIVKTAFCDVINTDNLIKGEFNQLKENINKEIFPYDVDL